MSRGQLRLSERIYDAISELIMDGKVHGDRLFFEEAPIEIMEVAPLPV